MGRRLMLRAGARTRVLWLYSSSVPGQVRFQAQAVGGAPATGTVELARKRWFTWHRDTYPLQARNVFDKGFSDGDYRIHVTPDQDCEITFETRHFRAEIFFRILAGILILGVISAITAFVFAPPATPSG